ncbi:DUF736 domain-containing protein [Parvibaculum sp.]|jgi:uncharacterized protein (DUF736 family)|uniref:DUF736 domain-containing protein n=1 Tax=Parvibaculum sp. TaxID=2024848 RepID=UPI002CA850D5|nr:DUF736 domain-containing protein [Parvibaculum sp.]HUD53259.1 DUF736 domain-containing protein [Parvibaculum sp.]
MSVIGMFTSTKEGGWSGTIRTLAIDAKLRFVPNDNRDSERAPAFKLFVGRSEVGAAWRERGGEKEYLSVRLDDPVLAAPVHAALFPAEGGEEAHLVWRRREG